MGLLRGLLEFVQVRKSTDDGLNVKLCFKAASLLFRPDIECEVEFIHDFGRREKATQESAPDITWRDT